MKFYYDFPKQSAFDYEVEDNDYIEKLEKHLGEGNQNKFSNKVVSSLMEFLMEHSEDPLETLCDLSDEVYRDAMNFYEDYAEERYNELEGRGRFDD